VSSEKTNSSVRSRSPGPRSSLRMGGSAHLEFLVKTALQDVEGLPADHPGRTSAREFFLRMARRYPNGFAAYQLLEDAQKISGARIHPPTVYRTLDWLCENGFLHRHHRSQLWLACTHPGTPHTPVYLECVECGTITEIAMDETEAVASIGHLRSLLREQAANWTLFSGRHEFVGVCPSCSKKTSTEAVDNSASTDED